PAGVAAAARDERQDAQPPHPGLQAEIGDPVHDPRAPGDYCSLDRRGDAGGDEAAQVPRRVVEGPAADDFVVTLTVAVEADLDLRSRRTQRTQQNLRDRDAVG